MKDIKQNLKILQNIAPEHVDLLSDLEIVFHHLEDFKEKVETEASFTAQDLYTLKQILAEFSKLEKEVSNQVSASRTESENELFILYSDALQKISGAKIFLEDVYQRHHAKLGEYYSLDESQDHELHSQKSPAQKLMQLMTHLSR